MQFIKRILSVVLFSAAILLMLSMPVAAAVTGFVAEGEDGVLYEYSYQDLLDSYALRILDSSDGFYEDFAGRKTYAILSTSGRYIDYQDILDRYAAALVNGDRFNLAEYAESGEAKLAKMPPTIKAVKFNSGKIVYDNKEIVGGETESTEGYIPRGTKTPLAGPAEATVEQARKWAESRGAHQRFIDIAQLYWDYGKQSGLRPEVLYAQAAMETNFGKYNASVPPEYNNWAGIKIKNADGDKPEDHEKFDTPEEGVRAHTNHLTAYTGLNPIGEPHDRYHVAARQSWAGSVLYVEDLSGKWAPAVDYHVYILISLYQILDMETKTENPGQDDNQSQPGSNPGNNNPDTYFVAVDVSILRLRGGPSTDHKILDRLSLGTVLEVTGSQDEWLKVVTPEGKNGWVHGDYVKKVEMNLSNNALKGKIIVVDPGHGGTDPGATGITGLLEKEINLAVAGKLVPLLKEAGAKVLVTRSGDQTVSNRNRVEMANKAGADVYVSIHANAFSNPDSNGTETFYCFNSDNSSASRFLAHQLQREMVSSLGLRDRGVKATSFYVLKNTEMPSALIELGFLTNANEEELLRKPGTHVEAARAIYEGLEAYFLYYR